MHIVKVHVMHCCHSYPSVPYNSVACIFQGKNWLVNYHKCLMNALLPLYRSDNVNCASMGYVLKQHRARCMVDGGFCGMIDDNEWHIELATRDYG